MNAQELTLVRAASQLTPADLRYLQENGLLSEGPPHSQGDVAGETAAPKGVPPAPVRRRRTFKHAWPEVGCLLEADYLGEHYGAEVVAAPRYKSGRAVRITTGPAAGEISPSLSGAMLKATETQREAAGVGRMGASSGWRFWKRKEGGA
jgi:hypothetical protein